MPQQLVTLEEVANTLNCTLASVRKWRREGRITVIKLGRLVRVPGSELDRIIKEGLRSVAPGRSR